MLSHFDSKMKPVVRFILSVLDFYYVHNKYIPLLLNTRSFDTFKVFGWKKIYVYIYCFGFLIFLCSPVLSIAGQHLVYCSKCIIL